jgi:hypothetical protein
VGRSRPSISPIRHYFFATYIGSFRFQASTTMTATVKLAIAFSVGIFLGLQFSQFGLPLLSIELQQQYHFDSFMVPTTGSESTDIKTVHHHQSYREEYPSQQLLRDSKATVAAKLEEENFSLLGELKVTKDKLNAHLASIANTGATATENPIQDSATSTLLTPTFPEFQDFKRGARPRFEAGKSQHDLLQETDIPAYDKVSFFEHKKYYAAAWLSSIQTFMKNKNIQLERLPADYNPNLEAGTWIGISSRTGYRTVDMMDFYVHHLSRYKGPDSVSPKYENNWKRFIKRLDEMQETYEKLPFNNPSNEKNGKVLAITPFHAGKDIHSQEDEKQLFLNITVKSLARVFPNIVVTVCDEANYNYVMNESGLNEYLYDVLLVKDLSMGELQNCIHLPALSSIQTREKIRDGSWMGFEFIYYTESDQPLHLRNVDELLRQTLLDDHTVITPHRSYPTALPEDLNVAEARTQARQFMNMTGFKVLHDVPDIRSQGCCFDKFSLDRKINVTSPELELFRQHNTHAQAAGTCNPLRYTCHICRFMDKEAHGPCKPIIF